MARPVHKQSPMKRKLAIIAAALIIPGGCIALLVAWLTQVMSRTERGQRYLGYARTSWERQIVRWREIELVPAMLRRAERA